MKNLHKVVLSIMVGILAIAFSAFTSANNLATQKWNVDNSKSTSTKIYLGANNLTGQIQDDDYTCSPSSTQRCSVQGDSSNLHTDANGTYFNASDASVITGVFAE